MLLLAGLVMVGSARADMAKDLPTHRYAEPDSDAPEQIEEQIALPALPKEADLIEFYVSAPAANRFFIDGANLSVGKDGIVRYTLVVKTSGGAVNTTFEGMRCKTGEYRQYASGRADGTWATARTAAWRPVENKTINRHHAALSRDLFCPLSTPIDSAQEGLRALRLGKHPRAP